jgi:leucyl-tRNA synthetase
MWSVCGYGKMLAMDGEWPTYDEVKCVDETIEIVVQVCGKIKAKLMVDAEISAEDAISMAKSEKTVEQLLGGKQIIKEIYVPKKLVNIVAK